VKTEDAPSPVRAFATSVLIEQPAKPAAAVSVASESSSAFTVLLVMCVPFVFCSQTLREPLIK
jgi:hypothetical protein